MTTRSVAPRSEVLRQIELDSAPEVAKAFLALATDYIAETRVRESRVSTLHTPAGLAARFEEPMPRACATSTRGFRDRKSVV